MELTMIDHMIRKRNRLCVPRVMFSGHVLRELGFVPDTLVRVSFHEDVLTFITCGIGIDVYRHVASSARQNKEALIYVETHKKYTGGLHLTLASNWLRNNGFNTFDVLAYTLQDGCIKARRLSLDPLPNGGVRKLYNVFADRKANGKTLSALRIKGDFLHQVSFVPGAVATITSKPDMIVVKLDPNASPPTKIYKGEVPKKLVVKHCKVINTPSFMLSGFWLQDFGFYPQDKLVVDCMDGLIIIRRIDTSTIDL